MATIYRALHTVTVKGGLIKGHKHHLSNSFADKAKAEEFLATKENGRIETSEEDTVFFLISNQFCSIDYEGFIRLGDISDSRCSNAQTYYCVPSEEEEGRKAFAKMQANARARQDSYYSQKWV